MVRLLPLLLLASCATAKSYATCDNAQRVVVAAQAMVARVCPLER
ncbi:hypothetical protein [Sphingobium cupriresistens]|uniref:Lipoprotein n=1 Tax=Sphingobium cupriresistens LL01 TaxID=1420583 RepID=A0A0J7Y5U6_9SPHN|nr:hypothetical protein [Sphingobium cupriresistens]KMS58763.1 hypothetical protein V473_07025 [Sphingobium cupriresistens LL01]